VALKSIGITLFYAIAPCQRRTGSDPDRLHRATASLVPSSQTLTPKWDGVNYFNEQMLDIVRGVTGLRHNRGTMMHSFLVGAVYVAIVITPCVVALFTGVDHT
jgi:hypothetical protein